MKLIRLIAVFILLAHNVNLTFAQDKAKTPQKKQKEVFHSSSKKKQQNVNTLIKKGVYAGEKQEYKKSAGLFKEASGIIDEQAAVAYHNLGYAYELDDKNELAIEAYQKAVERNPLQVVSLQNLGKLLYYRGSYEESIKYGEKALEIDPRNEEVPRWLPDAYRKAAERRIIDMRNGKGKKGQPEDSDEDREDGEIDECPGLNVPYNIEIGYSVTGAMNIHRSGKFTTYMVDSSPVKVPMDFYVRFRPGNNLEFYMKSGTPHFGLLNPSFLSGQEEVNFLFWTGRNYFGLGVLFTQADVSSDATPSFGTFIQNRDYSKVTDTKFGLIMGSRSLVGDFSLKVYSKYLFRDRSSNPKKIEIDHSMFELMYRRDAKLWKKNKTLPRENEKPFEMIISIKANELYITEYEVTAGNTYGHYLGYYDFTFGLEYGKIKKGIKRPVFTFGGYFTERLYMIDLNDSSPMAFGNGQGFFGLDTAKSMSGDAFSGYRSNSHIMGFFAKQMFQDRFIFKEELGLEYSAKKEDRHGIFIKLSAAFRF